MLYGQSGGEKEVQGETRHRLLFQLSYEQGNIPPDTASNKRGWQTVVLPFREINNNTGKLPFPSAFWLVC